uniref:Protein kinase domain-containing protein n=1 Tax=Ganoderma boninense TaxID=34458 RepID=A0A5K1JS83_9APHY|nr:Protein kinase domain-containing protein [Ganoderma boninense]
MAEVEVPLSPPAAQEEEILSETSGPVDAQPETDGEHEATDVVEAPSEPEAAGSMAEEKPSEDGENGVPEESDAPVDEMPKENVKDAASPPTSPSKKITAKSSISLKPSSAGKAGAPPTPLVKKIINSGTFGSGTVKATPAATKATAPPGATKTASSATATLRRSTTSAPATKPSSTTPAVTKPTVSASKAMPPPPAPTRRQSLAPSKASVPVTKAPAPATKAATPPTGRTVVAPSRPTPRASIASPEGATAPLRSSTMAPPRPRASVSEGVKRTVSGAKPAVSGASTPRPPSTASVKGRTPGAASISSIKEVQGESKILVELQSKLDDANSAISSKTETISGLESEVEILKSSLQSAQSEVESKATALAALEERLSLESSTHGSHRGCRGEDQGPGEKVASVDSFASQIAELKAENEEKANKVSELEVEILELKEEQETSGDEHSKSLARLQSLEADLAASAAAVQKALQEAQAEKVEHASRTEETAKAHQEEVDKAAAKYAELQSQLAALQEELAQAIEANEKAKADTQALVEKQQGELADAEKIRREMESKLSEEIARITADLESQESKYNAKVDVVKAEHDQLLQEAFERAKNEAGDVHSQDLQKLRAESQAAIEQLRSAHQVTIDELKTEHQGALERQVKALEKQLATQALELKATQEDLAKAKTNAAAVTQELNNVKAQLEEARSLVASLDKSDKDEVIAKLNRDLSNLREDHAALNEMFQATRGSLGEMADNHVKELEEAAKGRAEEVTKLRTAHQEEVVALATEKSQLISRLQDLEGEITAAKAALAAGEQATPQKTNGSAHHRSASISREDLQRLHEAHNAKIHDVQAEHDRAIRALREELEISRMKADELQQEVSRKAMEIQYLEQDQEESQDQITRYVKVFGWKSFIGAMFTLAVIYGLF